MSRPLPALAVLLAGLALAASPVVLVPHAGQQECGHVVERIDPADVPSGADVLAYRELSGDARYAFDAALSAPDGSAVVYGEACPEAFPYEDGSARHVIETSGGHYELTTFDAGGFFPAATYLGGALLLLGLVFAVLGGRSLYLGTAVPPGTLVVLGPVALVLLSVGVDALPVVPTATVALAVGFGGLGVLIQPGIASLLAAVSGIVALRGSQALDWHPAWLGFAVLAPLATAVGIALRRRFGS